MKKTNVLCGGVLLVVLLACTAGADEISDLKKQLAEMQARIEKLEAQQKKVIAEEVDKAVEKKQVSALPDSMKWVENVKISGDLRYRHETIDEESSGKWKTGRNRNRIRARLQIAGKVNDEWDALIRLASGTSDPVSTNQTLDEGFSSKEFRLDRAFMTWHPMAMPNLDVFGGKMAFPFYKAGKNELIWDGDLSPEGIAANYVKGLNESCKLYINGGGFWAEESSSGADQSLWGVQAYLKHTFKDKKYMLGGISYYDYGNTRRKATVWDDENGFGNTVTEVVENGGTCCEATKTFYVSDYDILELFGEYGFKVKQMPVTVFGSYVKNLVASTNDDVGWLLGFTLNKTKDPGSWAFRYNYRELQDDAVLGVFSDSDFIGGGTDGKGHEFGLAYQLAKNLQGELTYFMNEKGHDDDYRRLQADMKLKF